MECFLTQVASNTCKQDSVTSYNLHKDKEATPFGTGYMPHFYFGATDVTGTLMVPGDARVNPGDRVAVEIEGIGKLENPVVSE